MNIFDGSMGMLVGFLGASLINSYFGNKIRNDRLLKLYGIMQCHLQQALQNTSVQTIKPELEYLLYVIEEDIKQL